MSTEEPHSTSATPSAKDGAGGSTFRDTNAKDRSVRQSGDAAKKAEFQKGIDVALVQLGDMWHGGMAMVISAALLVGITWALAWVSIYLEGRRPPLVYYIIPIAFAAATLGRRAGMGVTLIAAGLSAVFIFAERSSTLARVGLIDVLGISGTLIVALLVVMLIGRLRESITGLSLAHARQRESDKKLIESEDRRVIFNKEVLLAVTGGRLLLCDNDEIVQNLHGHLILRHDINNPEHVTIVRKAAREAIVKTGRLVNRLYDFEAVMTEATTNAIKHGSGGHFELWDDGERIYALVADTGTGIEPKNLARATLERGFSTHISLGFGFKMMWELADLIAVSTNEHGTTILIRIGEASRPGIEAAILDRYPTMDI